MIKFQVVFCYNGDDGLNRVKICNRGEHLLIIYSFLLCETPCHDSNLVLFNFPILVTFDVEYWFGSNWSYVGIWTVSYTWFVFELRSSSSTADFHKSASVRAYTSGIVVGSVSSMVEFISPAKMWCSSSSYKLETAPGMSRFSLEGSFSRDESLCFRGS